MSDEMKKSQENLKKMMENQMKEIYGENFSNMEDLMKQALNTSLENLEKDIDIKAIQDVVPEISTEEILKKMKETKVEKRLLSFLQSGARKTMLWNL